MKTIVLALAWSFCVAFHIHAGSADGWTTVAPREEIRPQFQHEATGGKSGHGALIIRADEREGLHGWWQKTLMCRGAACWHACFGVMTRGRMSRDVRVC